MIAKHKHSARRKTPMPGRATAICLADQWFGISTINPNHPDPYDWYMDRVVAFVFWETKSGEVMMRAVDRDGEEFSDLTVFVFGADHAVGDLSWNDIYQRGEHQWTPGVRKVTQLVRPIEGFGEEVRLWG